MKILICGLKESLGGVEIVILNYAEQLIKANIECVFLIDNKHQTLKEKITWVGGEYITCPSRRENLNKYKKHLNNIFKCNNFDGVWCNLSGLTNIDILKLAKKYNISLRICHSHTATLSHNGILMKFLVPFLHYKNRFIIKNYVTHFWACSKSAGRFMFPKNTQRKVEIWHNAIDTNRFFPDRKLRQKTRKELNVESNYVIGHIARICKEKNQEFLLKIFYELLIKNNNAKLLFIGEGEEKQKLISLAKQLGICNNIIFLGEQFDTEKYYNAMDVFCLPSLSEGLGLTLIEAQSCGVPCVTSINVPKDSDITGTTQFLDFTETDNWCYALLNPKKIENPLQHVLKSGYDIKTQAKKMAEFLGSV